MTEPPTLLWAKLVDGSLLFFDVEGECYWGDSQGADGDGCGHGDGDGDGDGDGHGDGYGDGYGDGDGNYT